MRDRALHEVLAAFTADTAAALATEQADGEEIRYEVVEAEGRPGSPPLYCYRALTGEFIQQRMGLLSGLASYAPAARALNSRDQAGAYLVLRGAGQIPDEPRERADALLLAFLDRVFSERSDFELDPARFEAAYAELEHALLEGRATATVIAPLLGLALDERTWQIEIGEGLSLVRADRPDGALDAAPPEALWDNSGQPRVLAVLTVPQARSEPAPVQVARDRFRHLLSALRLYEHGSYALAALGWARVDFGPWRPVALGAGEVLGDDLGPPHHPTVISSEHEDELRGFCNLMARRFSAVRSGAFGSPELAWALSRFEMGRERILPGEALTDYLLALRALLEPEGSSCCRMPQRLALICAGPEERGALAERVAEAISLERAVITGMARLDEDDEELADEMAEHLRALLRDVLCGHLDADLVGVAERLLGQELAPDLV